MKEVKYKPPRPPFTPLKPLMKRADKKVCRWGGSASSPNPSSNPLFFFSRPNTHAVKQIKLLISGLLFVPLLPLLLLPLPLFLSSWNTHDFLFRREPTCRSQKCLVFPTPKRGAAVSLRLPREADSPSASALCSQTTSGRTPLVVNICHVANMTTLIHCLIP